MQDIELQRRDSDRRNLKRGEEFTALHIFVKKSFGCEHDGRDPYTTGTLEFCILFAYLIMSTHFGMHVSITS